MSTRTRWLGACLALAVAIGGGPAAADELHDGDVIAIVGDSITEGRQYSSLMEDYLLLCQPAKVRVVQLGWGGETAGGLVTRLDDALVLKPKVVTLCYGMNDGHYAAVTDATRSAYRANLLAAVKAFQSVNATVIVGSPGCVDTGTFVNRPVSAEVYNKTLAALRDEAASVAKETGSTFADVFAPMTQAMRTAKARYGTDYAIAGGDGIHPAINGGLVMAYAFLRAMGFDGNLGTIRVDAAAHTVQASGNHTATMKDDSSVAVTSTAWPFCVWGDPKEQNATAGTANLTPFFAELDRLTFALDGPAERYEVRWGKTSKIFTREQLHTGINLAAEFKSNPFSDRFWAVHQAVMSKQFREVTLFKQWVHSVNTSRDLLPERAAEMNRAVDLAVAAQKKLSADVTAMAKPFDHTISFKPVN